MTATELYDVGLINNIKDKLVEMQETVAVAESVTSGHLQVAFSLASQAMKFFQGGVTAYNLGQKSKHLHVNPIHAISCNCVSGTMAGQMALQVTEMFSCEWGIAVTGYASPDPEQGVEQLFAFYSISHNGKTVCTEKVNAETTSTVDVQLYYTAQILGRFYSVLSK